MFDHLIRLSLKNRMLVISLAAFVLAYGGWIISQLPVDVFPDLNRPTITIMAETGGLAPEEAELLVTYPIELAVNGTPGLERVRSVTIVGVASIYLEFGWGTDIYRNRQLVAERLELVKSELPPGVEAVMGPISSVMGDIQMIGLSSEDPSVSPMELRSIADWEIRPRILSIPGIAQVVAMGGDVKQFHILLSSDALRRYNLSIEEVHKNLKLLSENTTGGFFRFADKEFVIRNLGRVKNVKDIEDSLVGLFFGRPIRVKDIASVKVGSKVKRGEGSVNAKPAVIMTIKKQPGTSTIDLTKKIRAVIEEFRGTLPRGVDINTNIFNQADFIENAIWNVEEALRDGAILVTIILFLFLLNFRTTVITLTAIPLSFAITAIVFEWFGLGINTMTLGGLAVAIGELVDDAIVDVENVFRRLKQNRESASPKPTTRVVFEASREIRNSIVFATVIVILVFIPLFAMGGLEGRFFAPLGIAYVVSILASLVVSLTVTPALCSYLLPSLKHSTEEKDGWLVRFLKKWDERILRRALSRPKTVIGVTLGLLISSLCLIPFLGQEFLPKFNEGTAMVVVKLPPGVAIEYSDEVAREAEKIVMEVPEVKSVSRRTGRGELDEFLEGVHHSEIFVDFKEGGRPRPVVLNDIRERLLGDLEGIMVSLNQPISERLDFLLSGVKAQIAIKVFGKDIPKLRALAAEVYNAIYDVEGVVDLIIEQQVPIPQVKVKILREDAIKYNVSAGGLSHLLEMALEGETPCEVIEGQRIFDVFVRLDEKSRVGLENIRNIPIKSMPDGKIVHLRDVADVYESVGPNTINREDTLRRVVVQANSLGRDLKSLVGEIKKRIAGAVKFPQGYFVTFGGQFESQESAAKLMLVLGSFSMLAIFLVLYFHFRSAFIAVQIMLNIPMALIGSLYAIYLSDRTVSIASMVAFVTLCGIASRNGILMISHYLHLMKHEGEGFSKEMVIRGSLERLVPVLMTSLTAALALLPLIVAKGAPGKEILHPVAVVIFGGLFSSTLLDLWVTPTVFFSFGHKSAEKNIRLKEEEEENAQDQF